MLMSDTRGMWKPFRTASYLALLVLVALTLAVEGSQPVHTHDARTAALFNGECPLAALAAFHGASPLPDAPPGAWVAVAGSFHPPAPCEQPPASSVQHSDSRAPPPAPLA
jgi:hypothetical protein